RAGADLAAGEGFEGERGDEPLRLVGHADGHAGPELHQLADHVRDLVRRDPAADRDDQLAPVEGSVVGHKVARASCPCPETAIQDTGKMPVLLYSGLSSPLAS